MSISRRSLFRGFAAILAAPALARVAQLIPPLERARVNYLTLAQITRESVKMFMQSNMFPVSINHQYDDAFAGDAKVGAQLRIRLPHSYSKTSDAA